jgi:hypothetical protein
LPAKLSAQITRKAKVLPTAADEFSVNSSPAHFANDPQSATVEIVSSDGARRSLPCVVRATGPRRLVLELEEPIAASTALSVEYNDAMFLGEAVLCTAEGENSWRVELRIEQILTGLQSLMALRANLLGEAVPSPFHPAVSARN